MTHALQLLTLPAAATAPAALVADGPALLSPECLSDAELLARVLGGSPARRARLARALLDASGSLACLAGHGSAEPPPPGLGPAERRRLEAALELGRRAALTAPPAGPILEPADAYACVAAELCGAATERFVVVALDVKNRPLRLQRVAQGGVDSCPVDVREVFLPALRVRASGVLVAHNHPSGDPQPSDPDLEITHRLRHAGALLGIALVDHLIVAGQGTWLSFAERGLLGAGVRA